MKEHIREVLGVGIVCTPAGSGHLAIILLGRLFKEGVGVKVADGDAYAQVFLPHLTQGRNKRVCVTAVSGG